MRCPSLFAALLAPLVLAGCAISHRYPAYHGKVLELGTDRPIEGAGVLAVYETVSTSPGGPVNEYVGHQAVLTQADGRFEVPADWIWTFRVGFPLAWFDPHPRFTIYKQGYGNFPGSFGARLPKHGKADRELPMNQLPPDVDVTFWLPALEGKEEVYRHNLWMPHPLPLGTLRIDDFPPRGMTAQQFGY